MADYSGAYASSYEYSNSANRTPETLTDVEKEVLKRAAEDQKAQIAWLDDEIKEIQSRLDKVKLNRAEEQKKMEILRKYLG